MKSEGATFVLKFGRCEEFLRAIGKTCMDRLKVGVPSLPRF